MCSKCKDVLIGFKIKHEPSECPLMRSSYCSVCASYGHTTLECTDGDVLAYRKPQFVEQLIPPSIIRSYNITTRTPLVNPAKEDEKKCLPSLEVVDSVKCIRAMLMNHNIPISGKMKENRNRLERLADEIERKLIYLPAVDEESTDKKVTKPTKPKAKKTNNAPQTESASA